MRYRCTERNLELWRRQLRHHEDRFGAARATTALCHAADEGWPTKSAMPVMRPLFFDFPDQAESWQIEDQYMFGPDILVAPVLEAGQRQSARSGCRGAVPGSISLPARARAAGMVRMRRATRGHSGVHPRERAGACGACGRLGPEPEACLRRDSEDSAGRIWRATKGWRPPVLARPQRTFREANWRCWQSTANLSLFSSSLFSASLQGISPFPTSNS